MRLILALMVAAVTLALPTSAGASPTERSAYVVAFKDTIEHPHAAIEDLRARVGVSPRHRYHSAIKGFAADLDTRQVADLLRDPRVAFIQPDITFSATALTTAVASGESVAPGIRRIGAATSSLANGASTTNVAVLDTGVDLVHADLNAVSGTNCVKAGTAAQDDNGHGTHVAGIIGARNSGKGGIGVAPATKIYSVKVLGSRSTGTLSQVLCGIDWVTANAKALNIGVANLSLGATGSDDGNCGNTSGDAQHKAICRSVAAGVTYVASAGNAAKDFVNTTPAAYSQVLTATAMSDTDGAPGGKGPSVTCVKGEADDRYAAYSNFTLSAGAGAHAIAAPGTCVASTKLGGGTAIYNGTSQAAPHVAGTVALCMGSSGVPGPCAGLVPPDVIKRVRGDSVAHATLSNGFAGDLLRPFSSRIYGPLTAAGLY